MEKSNRKMTLREILHVKKNKKWKIATLIFGILNVILLCASVYVGLQQLQISDLKSQNISLQSQATALQNDVNKKNSFIIVLQNDMAMLKSQNGQIRQQIITIKSQLNKCQQELSNKTKKEKNLKN